MHRPPVQQARTGRMDWPPAHAGVRAVAQWALPRTARAPACGAGVRLLHQRAVQ